MNLFFRLLYNAVFGFPAYRFFFEQEAVVVEIRGMKKGVILSSKLPYYYAGRPELP